MEKEGEKMGLIWSKDEIPDVVVAYHEVKLSKEGQKRKARVCEALDLGIIPSHIEDYDEIPQPYLDDLCYLQNKEHVTFGVTKGFGSYSRIGIFANTNTSVFSKIDKFLI